MTQTLQLADWPYFAEDEIAAVTKVLQSGKVNYWTGNEARLFEQEFADYIGTEYAIALMNGTVALEAALYALDIGEGDDVIVTCRTFIASASAIVIRGARPIMADVAPDSQNITAETIKAVLTPKTKAIIAVHLAGWPCEMEAILALAKEYNLKVIEDCAQAHGAMYKGKRVGSFGDIAAFSFCQDKIMTTGGEGGMVTTNNNVLWEKMWSVKDHGKSYKAVYHQAHPIGFRWLHESFGTNWRMTEMQAAIGRLQLKKLSQWLAIRQRNAAILTESLHPFKALRIPCPQAEIFHAYYKYYVFIRPQYLKPGWDRSKIMQTIIDLGVPCFVGSCSEIYLEKAFDKKGFSLPERLPVAKELGDTSLMFLIHPTLTAENVFSMAKIVEKVFQSVSI